MIPLPDERGLCVGRGARFYLWDFILYLGLSLFSVYKRKNELYVETCRL